MSPAPLKSALDDGVLTLTLNRPEAGNALDQALSLALMQAVVACEEDAEVRCVVLTGEGRLFCGGGDIASFSRAGANAGRLINEMTACLDAAIVRLARMQKPLLTVINGPAAGAGLSLAVLGDVALAARSASFTLAYPRVGLTPDCGASWLLPRLIGLRRTQELVFTGRTLAAEEAASLGLVTRVVDDAALAAEAQVLARALADGPTRAYGATRNLLLASFESSFETHIEREARGISQALQGPEGQEGVAAFLAKRPPNFR